MDTTRTQAKAASRFACRRTPFGCGSIEASELIGGRRVAQYVESVARTRDESVPRAHAKCADYDERVAEMDMPVVTTGRRAPK